MAYDDGFERDGLSREILCTGCFKLDTTTVPKENKNKKFKEPFNFILNMYVERNETSAAP